MIEAIIGFAGVVGVALGAFFGMWAGKAKGKREGREEAIQEGLNNDRQRADDVRRRLDDANGLSNDDAGWRD